MARVGANQLLIFTRQFAAMMKSQLRLDDVLKNLAEETPTQTLQDAVVDIRRNVRQGIDLAEAMAVYPKIFDDIYIGVVKAGLAAGRLAPALQQVAHYIEVSHNSRKNMRNALLYPGFILFVLFIVFNIMVFFILPKFEQLYKSMKIELPWITQILIDIGRFWENNMIVILVTTAIIIAVFFLWKSTTSGRKVWDRRKLGFWVLGPLWRMSASARFLRTFAVQVENGVTVVPAIRLAAGATANRYIESILYQIARDIENGQGIAQSFKEYDVFKGIVLQMISSGEESGMLNELIMSSADYFDSLLADRILVITNMINPILTVLVGLVVGGMLIAAFYPVFDIVKSI